MSCFSKYILKEIVEMKRVFFCLVSVTLIAILLAAAIPAYATSGTDLYTPAKEGELLHELDFINDSYWKPTVTNGSFGFTALSSNSAEIIGNTNASQNWYGAELEGFPIDNAGYTITMTIIRNEKACFGLYIDGTYGAYGYAEQSHLMSGPSALNSTAHPYVKYSTLGYEFPGVAADGTALNDGSMQEYAMEVDGFKYNLRFYVKDKTGEWRLIDQTYDGEILTFYTYNLGIYFYSYYTQKATIGDIKIYKGYTVSGEKLSETTAAPDTTKSPDTTKAPETTKKPETTKADETTKAPGATAAVTTKAPVTTAAPVEKLGCGSILAGGAGMLVIVAAAGYSMRKRKR